MISELVMLPVFGTCSDNPNSCFRPGRHPHDFTPQPKSDVVRHRKTRRCLPRGGFGGQSFIRCDLVDREGQRRQKRFPLLVAETSGRVGQIEGPGIHQLALVVTDTNEIEAVSARLEDQLPGEVDHVRLGRPGEIGSQGVFHCPDPIAPIAFDELVRGIDASPQGRHPLLRSADQLKAVTAGDYGAGWVGKPLGQVVQSRGADCGEIILMSN